MLLVKGISASPGVVIGEALVLSDEAAEVGRSIVPAQRIEKEIQRLHAATQVTKEQLFDLKRRVSSDMGSRHAEIFNAHILFLEDPSFLVETAEQIRKEKLNAEWVVQQFTDRYARLFENVDDATMRHRDADIRDVGGRLIKNLQGGSLVGIKQLDHKAILIAYDLAPSDTAQLDYSKVKGLATEVGGPTSHSAILARTVQIPAVVGLEKVTRHVKTGDTVILDGHGGNLVVNPDKETLAYYRRKQKEIAEESQRLKRLRRLPAVTKDGVRVTLACNIELPEEARNGMSEGAEGIGLFRTEFLFLNRTNFPTEEEQFQAFRLAIKYSGNYPVIARTLDLGGDKFLAHLGLASEMNPFLGLRAIRLCLAHPYIFKVQLRAMLRASHYGNLKIMYPLISGVEELRQANAILDEVKADLSKRGIPYNKEVEVGVMIEVPSAAVTADLLAKECDFFSVGTNDLIQYTMAVDRGNERIAYLYDPLHPAILRSLKYIIDSAHKQKIWVGLCGEMAGDPHFSLVLLGLGLDEFSTGAASLSRVKRVIRGVTYTDARAVARKVLKLSTSGEIRDFLSRNDILKNLGDPE